MEQPMLVTLIPACVDRVQDGATGVLVPPRDANALVDALRAYVSDASLTSSRETTRRIRVLRDFREEAITEAMLHEYGRLCLVEVYPRAYAPPFQGLAPFFPAFLGVFRVN